MDKNSRSRDEPWSQEPAVQAVRKGKDAILSIFGYNLSQIIFMQCESGGYTPLLIAVCEGNKEIVQFLLDRGASVHLKGRDNRSLHLAAEEGQEDILKLLIDHQKTHKRHTRFDFNRDFKDLGGDTLLHSAVKGNINIVKYLLELGADIGASDLLVAMQKEQEEIVKLLLERGCQVNWRDNNNGNRLLHEAVEIGNPTIFKLLLDHGGSDVNAQNRVKETALHIACKKGNEAILKLLLDHGELDVNAQNTDKVTALHIACEKGNEALVRILINCGAQVHTTDWQRKTMLHYAAKSGSTDLLKLITNYGIDVNIGRMYDDETALHVACRQGTEEMVKVLIEAGARVNGWKTPVWLGAVQNEKMNVILMLFEYGCDLNVNNCWQNPLLHELHKRNCIDTLKTLILHGADINITSSSGDSLLHRAVERREMDLCEYLIDHGCKVNISNLYGRTALHSASREGYNDIVKRLVESGAGINAKTQYDTTPLLQACISGHETTVQLLLDYGASIEVNDRNNKNVVEQLFDLNNKRPAEILVGLIVRMKSRKLPVSQKAFEAIEESNEMEAYKVKCEKEIESMRSEDLAFWRLLMSNDRCLAGFARNEEMIRVLKSDECKIEFPIYSSILKNQMRKGLWRKMLLDKVQYFFKAVGETEGNEHLPKLPKLCVHEIFSYFANKDFKNLIKVCDPRGEVELCEFKIDEMLY